MVKSKKILLPPPDEINYVLLAFAVGIAIRLFFVLSSPLPLNDGGLFYTMTQDLIHSHFALPQYTSYNESHIPFTYPPLAFYLAGLITTITKIDLLTLFRFLPLSISFATIVVFYLISKSFLKSKFEIFFSVLAFSLLPSSYEWIIMGGGLTRSFGFLFALLSIYHGINLFKNSQKNRLIFTSLFLAITIVSHSEMALFALLSLFLFCFAFSNPITNLFRLFFITLEAFILSSPYWIVTLKNHGLSPFIAASNTVLWSPFSFLMILLLNITKERFLQILGVIGIIGTFMELLRKEYILPLLLLTIFIITPRGAPTYATVPFSLIIGVCIYRIIIQGLVRILPQNPQPQPIRYRKLANTIAAFLISYTFLGLAFAPLAFEPVLVSIRPEEKEAMEWVADNTKKGASFLVITPRPPAIWGLDRTAEWFPTFSKRKSLNVLQGYEWVPQKEMQKRLDRNVLLTNCYNKEVACLKDWQTKTHQTFEYIYFFKESASYVATSPISQEAYYPLLSSVKKSSEYTLIYNGAGATIFTKTNTKFAQSNSSHL